MKKNYKNNRIILHVDMDAFFASIEQRDNPAYRGKPVIVGADPKGGRGRGVVSTASYEARKFGIHSAMPISRAYRLCPDGIYVRPRMDRYAKESRIIMSILRKFSPLVEQTSIDEAFLDCTGTRRLFGSPLELGYKIKNKIKSVTSLTASVGIASNKSVAKIASDMKKPDGLTYCPPGKEVEFLYNLDIRYLWGAGKKTIELLKNSGYNKIGDISSSDVNKMVSLLGKNGLALWQLSKGVDPRSVEPNSIRKSIGKEVTFQKDVDNDDYIEKTIIRLVDNITFEMRKKGIRGKKVTLKIRLEDFSTFTRGKTLSYPTDSSRVIREIAVKRFKNFNKKGQKVRLIGVSVSELIFNNSDEANENTLFDNLYEDYSPYDKSGLPSGLNDDKFQELLEEMKLKFGDIIDRAIFLNHKNDNDKG